MSNATAIAGEAVAQVVQRRLRNFFSALPQQQKYIIVTYCSMGLGTKNRQKRTAELVRQHLRDKYSARSSLVEEYISEIEGSGKQKDVSAWRGFTDLKGLTTDTLRRVELDFERWLNPVE